MGCPTCPAVRSYEFVGWRRSARHNVDLPTRAGPLAAGAEPETSQFNFLPGWRALTAGVCNQQTGVNNIEPLGTEQLTARPEALSVVRLMPLEDAVVRTSRHLQFDK